jgi:uncharacterized membrane protein YfcA
MRQLITTLVFAIALLSLCMIEPAGAADGGALALPWWGWSLLLFLATLLLGIIAPLAGVGGGVLFVPIVGSFFPFHIDFVRGAGLLVALAGALAAGPGLLRSGIASLRLAMPLALLASISAIAGATLGLALPAHIVQIALGSTIFAIAALMWFSKGSAVPAVPHADALAVALKMNGVFHDAASDRDIDWRVHHTPAALALFTVIGAVAGMFGLGAGWANVPVLNLLMGAPLKVSVATSNFMLSIIDTGAAWVYLNNGAVLAVIAIPSVLGMMLGARIGVRLLKRARTSLIRKAVIGLLLAAGASALIKGFAVWH